jgi:hypothetical protein
MEGSMLSYDDVATAAAGEERDALWRALPRT